MPLPTASFTCVFSVNKIYFWERPSKILLEIEHNLNPGSCCIVTCANADFI
ncbi:MAG: methyltransferase domain-containing protein [Flavicella sp.]